MSRIAICIDGAEKIEAFLADRIYEFNAVASGYDDGESFGAVRESDSGVVEAGASGYTWGGCCYIAYLWVSEALRGKGVGSELLKSVEDHARGKGCRRVIVGTHSFQAPKFYARHGYQRIAQIDDHPVGYASILFAKEL